MSQFHSLKFVQFLGREVSLPGLAGKFDVLLFADFKNKYYSACVPSYPHASLNYSRWKYFETHKQRYWTVITNYLDLRNDAKTQKALNHFIINHSNMNSFNWRILGMAEIRHPSTKSQYTKGDVFV